MPAVKETNATAACPECEIGSFTRNHYFTGKLLVERDFRQEQDYYVDKLRLHEQRLHGWGVVCGLKVTQHENPACRDRFVCIEPGLAIDCCGHDIYVPEMDCIDLTQLDAIKALVKAKDQKPHILQICIRYKECPTEPIPVLYDDCGCDDTQCAPNRILESYEVDVMVDQPGPDDSPDSPALAWKNTINVAHASRVAYHDSTRRLYILTDDSLGFVYQVGTDNFSVLSSHALGRHGLALTVSNDGSRVYVVAAGANPPDLQQLHVLDTTQPGLPLVQAQPIDIQKSNPGTPVLAVLPAPDNRLLALVGPLGDLLRWETDIDSQAVPTAATSLVQLGANQASFVLSSNGTRGYSGGTGNQIQKLVIATPPATAIGVLPAGANVSAMAVVAAASGDLLTVVDKAANRFYLVDPSVPSLIGTIVPQHAPVGVVISPDARWAYVVEQDSGKSYVEPFDLANLEAGTSVPPGTAIEIGVNSVAPVISNSGRTLYVPFTGTLATPGDGGVAIIDIEESECCSKIWKALDGCPRCDIANCVVLATLKGFVVGDTFEDQTDPPADPATDTTNHVVRIDNRTGRRMLPSTSTLTEIVQCLCAAGKPKDGKDGKDGTNGEDGHDGKDGQGLEKGLTGIAALSWTHNSNNGQLLDVVRPNPDGSTTTPGLVIGFTGKIHTMVKVPVPPPPTAPTGTIPSRIEAAHIFQVLVEEDPALRKRGFLCKCPLVGKIVPVDFTTSPADPTLIVTATALPDDSDAAGIAFLFEDPLALRAFKSAADAWIQLRCDFVIDVNGKAVDGTFARFELPTGDRMGKFAAAPPANPFGIQGGLFESWFRRG